MTHYATYVRNQAELTEALQTLARQERGELPVKLQTPAERRKSAATVRAVERSVERFVERGGRVDARMKKVEAQGEY